MRHKVMFVSNQVGSLDQANLGFKLNGIMKEINQSIKGL